MFYYHYLDVSKKSIYDDHKCINEGLYNKIKFHLSLINGQISYCTNELDVFDIGSHMILVYHRLGI